MADLADEVNSSIDLVIDAYKKLQTKSPNDELLNMITINSDGQSFTASDAYRAEYVKEDDKYVIEGNGRYWGALEDRLKELD